VKRLTTWLAFLDQMRARLTTELVSTQPSDTSARSRWSVRQPNPVHFFGGGSQGLLRHDRRSRMMKKTRPKIDAALDYRSALEFEVGTQRPSPSPPRWVFEAWRNRPRMGSSMPTATARARHANAHRPHSHRSEFPPAIPGRVAPQQSALPLRRITAHTSSHEAGAISRQPTRPNFHVSRTGCSPNDHGQEVPYFAHFLSWLRR
jgi:hypothetical protein